MLTRKDTLTTSLVADKDASVLTIPTPTIETGVALSTQLTDVAALTGNQKLVKKTEKVQQQVSEVRQGISLAQESIARIERWGKKRSEPKALTAGSRTIEDREQGISPKALSVLGVSPSGLQFTLEAGGLPGDTFEVVSFNLTESYSQVFQLHVEALSRNPGVSGVLNGQAVLRVWQDGKPLREIRGMVSEFEAGDSGFHHTAYRLLITSDLWRLTLRNNSRIFQQKDIQTILSTVLSENSVAQYSFMLTDSHPEREFCVQYRETDFEFFNRLTAEEGIFYYVNAKGMLILTDDAATLSGRIQLSYNPNKNAQLQEKTVNRFTHSHKIRTSRAVLRDYTFKKPKWKAEFEVGGGYEHYDYPGRFKDARGKQYTGYRLDSLRRDVDIGWGETNSPQLYAGGLLQLRAHPNEEFNRVWQLTSVSYHGEQPQGGKQEAGDKATILLGTFEVIPRHQTWRPYQRTKPRVEGPQIAVVTGPPGEEIYTDNFGRVRLQFLWDREGKYDDHSSCWIRVAQPWAGKGWGMIAIPRVGQEVVVDFLDGDPDQPIVTGRTYHANMPLPAELPKHKTQMHLMSQTYKGGGYNGMVMEDKKGRQRLDFQAQKDMNTLVLNNRTTKVKGNHTETVKGEQKLSVQQTRLKNVVGNETVDIGAEQIVTVGKDYRLKVKNELFMKSDLESIIFETAGARLTLHKEGNIALEAKEVRILGKPVELNPGGAATSSAEADSVPASDAGAVSDAEKAKAIAEYEAANPENAQKVNNFLAPLEEKDRNEIKYLMYTAKEPYRSLGMKYLDKMRIVPNNNKEGYFQADGNFMTVDFSQDRNNPRGNYYTFFHELGHGIDYYGGRDKLNMFQRAFKSSSEEFLSEFHQYNGKTLSEHNIEDAANYVRKTGAGYYSKSYEQLSGAEKTSVDNITTILTDPTKKISDVSTNDKAVYTATVKNINSNLQGAANESASDVYGGVSGLQMSGSWSHRQSYWVNSGKVINTTNKESFAEYYGRQMILDPEKSDGLNSIKQYLPKSTEHLEQIIIDLAK